MVVIMVEGPFCAHDRLVIFASHGLTMRDALHGCPGGIHDDLVRVYATRSLTGRQIAWLICDGFKMIAMEPS